MVITAYSRSFPAGLFSPGQRSPMPRCVTAGGPDHAALAYSKNGVVPTLRTTCKARPAENPAISEFALCEAEMPAI